MTEVVIKGSITAAEEVVIRIKPSHSGDTIYGEKDAEELWDILCRSLPGTTFAALYKKFQTDKDRKGRLRSTTHR